MVDTVTSLGNWLCPSLQMFICFYACICSMWALHVWAISYTFASALLFFIWLSISLFGFVQGALYAFLKKIRYCAWHRHPYVRFGLMVVHLISFLLHSFVVWSCLFLKAIIYDCWVLMWLARENRSNIYHVLNWSLGYTVPKLTLNFKFLQIMLG